MAHAHRAVERALLDKIHPDRIRIVASSFLVALAACFEPDLILTAPARVIGRLAEVYGLRAVRPPIRPEEHTSELQSLMRNSYAVFCLQKKTLEPNHKQDTNLLRTSK